MAANLRTFIAIELPPPVCDVLRRLQSDLKRFGFNVRWVRTDHMHLTLKFMGNVPPDAVDAIGGAMRTAAQNQASFDLKAAGVGVFPQIRNPRVIWAGLSGDVGHLKSFQASLDNCLADVGVEKEKRSFKGHLTLGRTQGNIDAKRLMDALIACGGFASEVFPVRQVVFFQSDLQKGGPVYTRLLQVPLGRQRDAS